MIGFTRSRLSFDFLDYHTFADLVAESWLPIMHQSWFGMSTLNALPFSSPLQREKSDLGSRMPRCRRSGKSDARSSSLINIDPWLRHLGQAASGS